MLSQGRGLASCVTLSWWFFSVRPCEPHVCLFFAMRNFVSRQLKTTLLTVWSGSLLTWPLNRRRDYNKQGHSKSNPPSTRCRFGKLYPGKPFLKSHLLWLFLLLMLQNSSQSPNSPMVSIHHFKNKGLAGGPCPIRESLSAILPYCVSLECQHTHPLWEW